MRSSVKPSGRSLSMMFFSASCASIFEIGTPRRLDIATSLTKEPSSSRTLLLILLAIKMAMSSGRKMPSRSALRFNIATFVSRSGGSRSAINPHSNRECSRSSNVGISFGGQSLVITICFWSLCSVLNV